MEQPGREDQRGQVTVVKCLGVACFGFERYHSVINLEYFFTFWWSLSAMKPFSEGTIQALNGPESISFFS